MLLANIVKGMGESTEIYSDHPMDLAGASLVALAEARDLRQVFTLDRNDFQSYRLRNRRHFQVVP